MSTNQKRTVTQILADLGWELSWHGGRPLMVLRPEAQGQQPRHMADRQAREALRAAGHIAFADTVRS